MAMESFKKIKSSIEDFKKEIKGILLKAENNIILTDNDDLDRIYGYCYNNDSFGELDEFQVKGIRLKGERIEVLFDVSDVVYEMNDLLKASDENWIPLFGSEVLGWFTAINIAEVLDDYLDIE